MKNSLPKLFIRGLAVSTVTALAFTANARADHHEGDKHKDHKEHSQHSTSTSSTSSSDSQTASSTDKAASKFLMEAAHANNMEIAMGELGQRKAQNAELKSFAQHLKDDHTKAKTKLTALAEHRGLNNPEKPDKHEKELSKLEQMSGQEFDRAFTMMALKNHQKDIAKYQKAIQTVKASDVKSFAQETLPKLQQHLSQAARVAQAVGIDAATISTYTTPAADAALGGSTTTGEDLDSRFETTKEAGAKNQKGHGAHSLKQGEPASSSSSSPTNSSDDE